MIVVQVSSFKDFKLGGSALKFIVLISVSMPFFYFIIHSSLFIISILWNSAEVFIKLKGIEARMKSSFLNLLPHSIWVLTIVMFYNLKINLDKIKYYLF